MQKKGFTLVELIVVIGLIGILTTIGVSSYQNIQISSRNLKRKSDLKELKTALQTYFAEEGNYPSTSGAWWGHCSAYGSHGVSGANGYIPDLAPEFIDVLPLDPRDSQANGAFPGTSTCYLYRSNGADYKLLAFGTPEGANAFDPNEIFLDPFRPTQAWQVSSNATVRTTW